MRILPILNIVFYISIFQMMLVALFLFTNKGGSKLIRFPVISLLIVWSIFTSGSFILISGNKNILLKDIGHLMNLSIFLTAPIMYVYFKTLFVSRYKISFRDLYHTIPFTVVLLYMVNKIIFNKVIGYVFYPAAIILVAALFVQNIIYYILIQRTLNDVEGNRFKPKLKIYKFLLYGILVVFFLKLAIFIVWNVLKYVEVCIFMTDIFFTIVFIIINSLILFSLNNPDLLVGAFKYQANDLSEDTLKEHISRISDYMFQHKIFTDPLISLERLSKNLKLPEKIISQVINQATGNNFNDFINSCRIEYVKELMQDKNKKILEIAYEAGFNSKTTFNTAFKKFTGVTPSEYKKNISSAIHTTTE